MVAGFLGGTWSRRKGKHEDALVPERCPTTAWLAAALACSQPILDDAALLAVIGRFERSIQRQPRTTVQAPLRRQAADFKGRTVRVASGVVAIPSTRENDSHIDFGTGDDPADHLFLRAIDPSVHASRVHHRLWASVVKTDPSRQLSYELPVDEATFARLRPGRRVTFSCRIAALIGGKNVYRAPDGLEVRIDAEPGPTPAAASELVGGSAALGPREGDDEYGRS